MNKFAVISNSLSEPHLRQHVDDVIQVANDIWFVSADCATAFDLSEVLRLQSDEGGLEKHSGIVLKIDEYYGCWNPSVWQKLSAWSDK